MVEYLSMCLGYAMRLVASDGFSGTVERLGGSGEEPRRVSLLLTGDQPLGTLLLVHVDAAIRVLDAEEAHLIDDAIRALEAAMRGESTAGFFADLEREPQLPEHLRPAPLVQAVPSTSPADGTSDPAFGRVADVAAAD